MSDELRSAIQNTTNEGMVTRYLIIGESMNAEGKFQFWIHQDGMTPWDVRGFLSYAFDVSEEAE